MFLLFSAGTAECLFTSGVIICAAISSAIFLGEKIQTSKAVAMVMSIAGILLVTQPDFLFKHKSVQVKSDHFKNTPAHHMRSSDLNQTDILEKDTNNRRTTIIAATDLSTQVIQSNHTSHLISTATDVTISPSNHTHVSMDTELQDPWLGYILIIVSILTTTSTIVIVRSEKTVNDITTRIQLLWIHAVGASLSVCLMGILETPVFPSKQMKVLFLAGHVLFSFIGSSLYYYALSLVSGIIVALIASCGIIFSYFIQYAFLKNSEKIVAFEIPGTLLSFLAACLHPAVTILQRTLAGKT